MYAIEMTGVGKSYPAFSLRDVNLRIQPGYITGLIGRNGAGKTTLIKSILGMVRPDQGTISILGKSMAQDEIELKNKIGIILGNGYFYEGMTLDATKNMLCRFYREWDEEAYQGYMKKFGLSGASKVKTLSTGMREKFSIAIALSHHADLLIMDEPAAGLDPVAREELMDILSEYMQDGDKTVLLSTHITSDLDRTADYIVLVDQGQILLDQPKDALLEGHRLVKGDPEQLTTELKKRLVSYKEGRYGFEGLAKGSVPGGLVAEKPTIEDIMRFYTK